MADAQKAIDAAAEAFYRALPEGEYPKALIDGYPRIADKIFALRGNKEALRVYFEGLLTDDRGGRQGFPFPVIVNVQNLYDTMVGISDGFIDTGRFFTGRPKK